MFAVIVWVIIAALLVGATKGLFEGADKDIKDYPAAWAVSACLYVGLLLYFAPWEEEPVDPKVAAQQEANEQGARTLREGMSACDARVKAQATIPSSVDFHLLATSRNMRGSTAHIDRRFTAQNAYGTEIEHTYRCRYKGGRITAFSITN